MCIEALGHLLATWIRHPTGEYSTSASAESSDVITVGQTLRGFASAPNGSLIWVETRPPLKLRKTRGGETLLDPGLRSEFISALWIKMWRVPQEGRRGISPVTEGNSSLEERSDLGCPRGTDCVALIGDKNRENNFSLTVEAVEIEDQEVPQLGII